MKRYTKKASFLPLHRRPSWQNWTVFVASALAVWIRRYSELR